MSRIVAARVWQQYQPFVGGAYVCRGQAEHGFHATIVALEDADGIVGWGEAAPERLRDRLDAVMLGQPAVKSAIDMAAWDLAARRARVPLCVMLGGAAVTSVPLYRSISQAAPEDMAQSALSYLAQGYRRLQVKVGQDPLEDIERLRAVRHAVPEDVVLYADANGGWLVEDALRFLRGVADLDFWLEQPCMSLAENRIVARACSHPFVLDESITGLEEMLTAQSDGMISGVTLKIARLGSIGPTRLLSDVAVRLGLKVTIEDTGGSTLNTAATAHMMARLPARHAAHTVDFMNWVTVQNADPMPRCHDGRLLLPLGPGIGVEALVGSLGAPFAESA